MRTSINLSDFNVLMNLLDSMRQMGLLAPASYMVLWEKKPRLTINRLGNFEFENPQEVYGAVLTFWDGRNKVICSKRFTLTDRFEDKS
jgi:hypothetical protein